MTATAEQPEQEPDHFSNQRWMIGEIILAYQILGRKIDALRVQNETKAAVGQKLAAEEVVRLTEQLKLCAAVVVAKSAEYVNRKPRIK